MLFGIDVSSNQTVTSYPAARAAVNFVYIRVRRSNALQDTAWHAHHDGFAGVQRAPYIFLRPPSTESFDAQFESFWGWCGSVPWEWGPVIDAEYSGLTSAQANAAVASCRKVTGHEVVYLYEGFSDLTGAARPSGLDESVRLIAARYFADNEANAFANLGFDSPNLDITQYWDKGSVPGISTAVDLNAARQIISTEGVVMTNPFTLPDKDPGRGTYGHDLLNVFQQLTDGGVNQIPVITSELSSISKQLDAIAGQIAPTAAANDTLNGSVTQLVTAVRAIKPGSIDPAALNAGAPAFMSAAQQSGVPAEVATALIDLIRAQNGG